MSRRLINSSCEVQASCNRSNKSKVNKWRYAEQINCEESLIFLFPFKKCKVKFVQLYTLLKKTADSVSETLCFFLNMFSLIYHHENPVEQKILYLDCYKPCRNFNRKTWQLSSVSVVSTDNLVQFNWSVVVHCSFLGTLEQFDQSWILCNVFFLIKCLGCNTD